jgi:hypothetical protein
MNTNKTEIQITTGTWHLVLDEDGTEADVYCADPECEGQYVTAAQAAQMVARCESSPKAT